MRRPFNALVCAALITAGSIGLVSAQFAATPPDFVAGLSGDNEVPVRLTAADGVAQFKLIEDGMAIAYRVMVTNIENVVASHIHLGLPGVNGPVVAFLAGNFPPGGGLLDGLLAEGVIRSSNLVGPLAGQNISVLIEAIRTGGAYVNVHTNDGVDPTNTGAGDFPGGEIRGPIQAGRDRAPIPLIAPAE